MEDSTYGDFLAASGGDAKPIHFKLTKLQREHLKAYGRAEHDPLVPNDSEMNRNMNRRIEIIFKPDLERIYAVLSGQ